MHGTGTAAAIQLCEQAVLGCKRDGVLAPERVLLQTPALPGASGPHGHHGQLDPVPSDVSPRVRDVHITLTSLTIGGLFPPIMNISLNLYYHYYTTVT